MNTVAARPAPPTVSILVPAYRQAPLVVRAVGSALAQDYPALHVHVVDDASPDDTAERIAAIADLRLSYHRNPRNLGRVANYRHALYDIATGDWVVNLDGDDEFTDAGFVSAAIEAAQEDPAILLVAARAATRIDGRDTVSPQPRERILDGRLVALRAARREFHLMHLATLYRREAAKACDFYRCDAISADWESLYRLACRGKVAFIDRVAGAWNVADTGASQAMRAEPQLANLRIWPSIEKELIEHGIPASQAAQAMRAAARTMAEVHGRAMALRAPAEALRFLAGLPSGVRAGLLAAPGFWVRLAAGALGVGRRQQTSTRVAA